MKKYLSSYPELVKEWHPTKNGDLTPRDVTHGSKKKVWWLCPKGHSYETAPQERTRKKSQGCSYCAGKKVHDGNSLKMLFPQIAKEWHPFKNGKLSPYDFTSRSDKIVWWQCSKGHSYRSMIKNRTRERGCPKCSNQSSEPEIRILSEFKYIFNEVRSRYKIQGKEIDIYIPKYNLGIEYDGRYWHKGKEKQDLDKHTFLVSLGINLIRIRQSPLKPLSVNDVQVDFHLIQKKDLDKIFEKVISFVEMSIQNKIKSYIDNTKFVNEDLYKKYRSYFPSPFPENSLSKTHSSICKEWDYIKNHPIRPENFTYGSNHKVWWLCTKGHSYQSPIKSRTKSKPSGCPYCSGRKATQNNNLKKLFPQIAKEWHPTKNRDLTPENVTYGSGYKAWWLCSKGHDFVSGVYSRTGKNKNGCPYCSGKKTLNYDLFE